MEKVATYTKNIPGYGTVQVTAKSASELDINPTEVETACQKIKEVAEESFDIIGSRIMTVECGRETLAAEDSSMEPVLEETGKAIKTIPNQIDSILEEINSEAVKAHDQKQRRYNEEARTSFNAKVSAAETQASQNNQE